MMRLFYIVCLFYFYANLNGQTLNWSKTYGGQGYDEGQSAVELADSSFVIVGSTSSFYNSNQNILFMKVDSTGKFLYSNFIDNGFWDSGKKIIPRNNAEFWICGSTNSIGSGGFDGYLVKVDSLGNKISDFTFGGSDWDFFNDMIMLSDSSLVMVGETQSFGNGNKDAYIVKVNKNGDTLWTKTIGTSKDDFASALTERNDTLYITGGISDELSDSTFGLYLALDLNGNVLLNNRMNVFKNQYLNDLHQFNSNDLYFVGTTIENGEKMIWFQIADYIGNPLGAQHWTTPGGNSELVATITYPGTAYMLTCLQSNAPGMANFNPSYDIQICKTTPGANWNYAKIYGFLGDDYPNDIIPTMDQGALIIGSNADIAIGGRNLMLVKIGAQDNYPANYFDSINPITTSIDELEIQDLQFYPNPVSTSLHIQLDDLQKEKYKYRIVSYSGQLVDEGSLLSNQLKTDLLEVGLYFIQVWSDRKLYQSKFLKE